MAPIAVCVGATSGIGAEAAIQLASQGWDVYILGRDASKGAQIVAEAGKKGNKAQFIACDVSTIKGTREVCGKLNDLLPCVDALIQTQGVLTLENVRTADGLPLVPAVQILSRFLITKLLLPLLKKSSLGARALYMVAPVSPTQRIKFDRGEAGFPTYNPKWTGFAGMGEVQISIYHLAYYMTKTEPWLRVALVNAGLVNTGILRDMPKPIQVIFPMCCCCMTISVGTSASNLVYLATTQETWASGTYLPKPGNSRSRQEGLKLNEEDGVKVLAALNKLVGE